MGEEDKRKYPRKQHLAGVTYSVIVSPQGSGLLKDASEGGLGLLLDKHIAPETIIKVNFSISDDNQQIPIEAVVKVMWCRKTEEGYLTGTKFIN